jgi:mannose-6-phosphate isomerase
MMHQLHNPIRDYSWGSHTVLADFLGRPSPTPEPQAELWIGAHPAAPSVLHSGVTLDAHIAADPAAALGTESVSAFGPRLPFLLKVLAVAEPLSLQVHPDRQQAERGFAAELTPLDDPARNYKDSWPKPELLCALTDFRALCGLRDPRESAELLGRAPSLHPVADRLARGDLRGAVEMLLTWPSPKEAVAEATAHAAEPYTSLAARHPADMGVLVAMLMHDVHLTPGQALYVPPRMPHAYLTGTGVELMAGSDNVLRAGLTPKHVDVPELLTVALFEATSPHVVEPAYHDGVHVYPTPAPEFQLSRLDAADAPVVSEHGPSLFLCSDERVRLRRGTRSLELRRGEAVFAGHDGPPVELTGTGTVFRASLPRRAGVRA